MTSNISADRRRTSSAAITALMRPRSVAIIGVSAKPGSAGRVVLELLGNNKFSGPIYLVGRSTADIDGHKVLSGIDDLPEDVDLPCSRCQPALFAKPLKAACGEG